MKFYYYLNVYEQSKNNSVVELIHLGERGTGRVAEISGNDPKTLLPSVKGCMWC